MSSPGRSRRNGRQARRGRLAGMISSMHGFADRNPFTATGRLYALAVALGMLAIFEDSLVSLLSYSFWALAIAFVVGLIYRPKLQISLTPIRLCHVGEQGELCVRLRNAGRLPAYDLSLACVRQAPAYQAAQAPVLIDALAADEEVTLRIPFTALRRGVYRAPAIVVRSLFPFGLFSYVSRLADAAELVIAPRLIEATLAPEVNGFPSPAEAMRSADSGSSWEPAGISLAAIGDEYLGSREFQAGLSVRRWDFASWARMGRPAVREYADAREAAVCVIVDGYNAGSQRSPDDRFEAVLSQAASLTLGCFDRGQPLRLWLASSELRMAELDTAPSLSVMHLLAEETGTPRKTDWPRVFDSLLAADSTNELPMDAGETSQWWVIPHDHDPSTLASISEAAECLGAVFILPAPECER